MMAVYREVGQKVKVEEGALQAELDQHLSLSPADGY